MNHLKLVFFPIFLLLFFISLDASEILDSLKKLGAFPSEISTRKDLIAKMPINSTIILIGDLEGDLAQTFYETLFPKKMYFLDWWVFEDASVYTGDPFCIIENAKLVKRRKRFHPAKSNFIISNHYSRECYSAFKDESIDCIYIDVDRSYKSISEDLELWWPKINKGGFLCGSGYDKHTPCGTAQALNEFFKAKNLSIFYLTTEENIQSWGIQKPGVAPF